MQIVTSSIVKQPMLEILVKQDGKTLKFRKYAGCTIDTSKNGNLVNSCSMISFDGFQDIEEFQSLLETFKNEISSKLHDYKF